MTVRRARRSTFAALAIIASAVAGCSLGPKGFFDVRNPAPLVRARASVMGRRLPDAAAIPPLIDRLDDPDGVVRLTAHEELRRRTGMDFGYVPWGDPLERGRAVMRWRSWWSGASVGLAGNRQSP